MKTNAILWRSLGAGLSLGLLLALPTLGQNTLLFTSNNATVEGAIQLHWTSTNNEVYEIDYANALNDNNGTTTWNPLYTDYPSQGSNTLWLDTGNYHTMPAILHPKKMPVRFYRVVDEGADGTSSEPFVSISNPTNGSDVSSNLTIIVSAKTDQATLLTKLYVDGEEMPSSIASTNYSNNGTNYLIDTYIINTCEWPNGPHTLFATAKCGSAASGPNNAPAILLGHAASAFVPVTFDNLITRFSFSEPFFNPAAGQTQQVSAIFTANCNWTLQIQDVSTNTVRYVTGSGGSMEFDWDGTGTNGASIPDGVYSYLLTVQTNGQAMPSGGSGGGGSPGIAPSPAFASSSTTDTVMEWALPENSDNPVPLTLFPPGFNTNGFTIFEASQSEMRALNASLETVNVSSTTAKASSAVSSKIGGGGITFNGSSGGGGGGSSSQSTRGPVRLPTNPVKGVAGQFGIAWQDFFPEMLSIAAPPNGLPGYPSPPRVQIEGSTGSASFPYLENNELYDFIDTMHRGAWQPGFIKRNNQLQASDLRRTSLGGANAFNNGGSLGLLSVHGAYGTAPDYDQTSGANGATQIYFAVDGRPGSSSYVRMSEMSFGSPGTNGLKWMALLCCNSLRQNNWNSIQNTGGWKPFNGNLHLLLGANSTVDSYSLKLWAKFMLGLDNNAKETIYNAWQDSAHYSFHHPVQFAIAGFSDCKQDMLTGTNGYTPQGSVFYDLLPVLQ